MSLWGRMLGRKPAPRRTDAEVASEIASLLESSVYETGPGTLLSPTACVAINALGIKGFSLWGAAPDKDCAYVSLADLPAMREIRELFASIDPEVTPAELIGEFLAALLPRQIDLLAMQVWAQFSAYTKPGGLPPPLPSR